MSCRRVKTWTDEDGVRHRDVVYFGSYGINKDGTAKFYNEKNIHDNYSTGKEAIADALVQQLSILKRELWYQMNFGIPLFEKYKSVSIIDAYVVSLVSRHRDVKTFLSFTSKMNGNQYSCAFTIDTVYGNLVIEI